MCYYIKIDILFIKVIIRKFAKPSFMLKNLIFIQIFIFLLVACSQNEIAKSPQNTEKRTEKQKAMEQIVEKRGVNLPSDSTLIEDGGILSLENIFGFDPKDNYAINSILFSVALDKIDFMPLASVDANSGVIVTDWYSFDQGKTRIKINLRVINEEMQNESLTVSLFKQTFENNNWVDTGKDEQQAAKIKNSILSTARDLKIASEL